MLPSLTYIGIHTCARPCLHMYIHTCIYTRACIHRDAHQFTHKSLTLPVEQKSACSPKPAVSLCGHCSCSWSVWPLWHCLTRVNPSIMGFQTRTSQILALLSKSLCVGVDVILQQNYHDSSVNSTFLKHYGCFSFPPCSQIKHPRQHFGIPFCWGFNLNLMFYFSLGKHLPWE